MSGTMLYKPRLHYPHNLKKLPKFFKEIYSVFILNDEDFVSRTINDSNIHSNKFLASKMCQLAKKMESSKATAKHIK